MQCSCGGETKDHKVIRQKQVAGLYAKCQACGRICWIHKTDQLKEELDANQTT